MTVQVDTREKPRAIEKIIEHFDKSGIKHFRSALPVGDYASLDHPRRAVDRKQSLMELHVNLCQDHERFRRELLRAQDLGIELIFLVEHSRNIKTLTDVRLWNNPRLAVSPYALTGMAMYQRLHTIQMKYGVKFYFCSKAETGRKIIEILEHGKPYQITIGQTKGD